MDPARPDMRHFAEIEWSDSPGGEVQRKRYFHRGPAESGQVTSLVRYVPGARFPAHAHPQGEEILVLDGVFSDRTGDYPAGAHLLNPEGFSHAPWSTGGCLLFVKLRQYAAERGWQQYLQTDALNWQELGDGGARLQLLRDADGRVTCLERWSAQRGGRLRTWSHVTELFVMAGQVRIGPHTLRQYDWMQLPTGHSQTVSSDVAGAVYLRRDVPA